MATGNQHQSHQGLARTARFHRPFTAQECFANLLRVWAHYGRPPRYAEMSRPPSTVGVGRYLRWWGTWRRALAALIEWQQRGVAAGRRRTLLPTANHVAPATAPPPPRPPAGHAAARREPTLRTRYAVLTRDRFRCVLCGRSPATEPGSSLEVDHIIPVAQGGRAVMDNLRTLCRECNRGKGAR